MKRLEIAQVHESERPGPHPAGRDKRRVQPSRECARGSRGRPSRVRRRSRSARWSSAAMARRRSSCPTTCPRRRLPDRQVPRTGSAGGRRPTLLSVAARWYRDPSALPAHERRRQRVAGAYCRGRLGRRRPRRGDRAGAGDPALGLVTGHETASPRTWHAEAVAGCARLGAALTEFRGRRSSGSRRSGAGRGAARCCRTARSSRASSRRTGTRACRTSRRRQCRGTA